MGVNCGLAVIEVTDRQGLIVGAIFIAALIGTIVWACISEVKKRKKQLLELESEEYTPPPIEEHIARLNFKNAEILHTGIDTPQHYSDYYAVFEFDGKETKLSVPPKMYAGLSVGSTGRLITEDGKFLDFIINDE